MSSFEPPHPNGGPPAENSRSHPPWEFIVLMLFVALIGIGIILAWTLVGSKSPERLTIALAAQYADACNDAQSQLKALPSAAPRSVAERVDRIRDEDRVLTSMVARFSAVPSGSSVPEKAARGWSGDWSRVIESRERYANDLQSNGKKAELVLPAASGVKPVTQKMDDYVRENHPNLNACFTDALELDVVEGARTYKAVTG